MDNNTRTYGQLLLSTTPVRGLKCYLEMCRSTMSQLVTKTVCSRLSIVFTADRVDGLMCCVTCVGPTKNIQRMLDHFRDILCEFTHRYNGRSRWIRVVPKPPPPPPPSRPSARPRRFTSFTHANRVEVDEMFENLCL